MKAKWLIIVLALILTMAFVPISASVVYAADSGGYGAEEESSGYGAEEESSGYGAEEESSGYGAEEESSGYGAEEESSGYGADEGESSGYGDEEESAGYGDEEDAAKTEKVAEKPGKKKTNIPLFIITALAAGIALGWVLQRGRFCMNSAFRDTIFIQDWTFFHSYLIAVVVAIVGANLLMDLSIIKLTAQPFWPVAHIAGGFIFGLGIVLAGGCGSGIWYRMGEGLIAAWVAVFGFFLSIGITSTGILSPVYKASKKIMLLADEPTLYQAAGATSMTTKWTMIAVIAVVAFFFIRKSGPFKLTKAKGYYWSVTGLLVGLVAVAAFYLAYQFGGGFARGLSFTTPTIELFNTLTLADSKTRIFPVVNMLGYIKTTWGVFFIIGVPLGAYLSARGLSEFAWKVPPAKELLTVFGGSLLMGFGATLALGCNMGQGITGVATLSIGSIVATISIILGNWTMVYFKFIKPMNDMDLDDD